VITLNGEPAEGGGATVEQLLARLDVPGRGVAVAVDAEVVPKSEWASHVVPEGAHVEVVTAVQGG
jgi:sulfur carrier protein